MVLPSQSDALFGVFGEEDFVAARLESAREEDAVVFRVVYDEELGHAEKGSVVGLEQMFHGVHQFGTGGLGLLQEKLRVGG